MSAPAYITLTCDLARDFFTRRPRIAILAYAAHFLGGF